jgi:hypothetical protein
MKLSDFKKDQIVYVKESVYRQKEPEIHEANVISVGRKYVTVKMNGWGEIKFDASNDFRQVTDYTPTFYLYLIKEDIHKEMGRNRKERKLEEYFSWRCGMVAKLSDDDLERMLSICEKYDV